MAYNLRYKGSVEKDLRHLPKEALRQALNRIEGTLRTNPFLGEKLTYHARHFFKYRIRDYRIIYTIDTERKEVIIHRIRHRKEVYRGL